MIGQWLGRWLGKWFGYGGSEPIETEATAFDFVIEMLTGRKAMEPQTFEKRQGNSLWLKIKCSKWASINSVWSNFAGTWELFDNEGISVGDGVMILSATEGILYVKLSPALMLSLAEGAYMLVSEVTNAVADYKEERIDSVVVAGLSLI